MSFHGFENERSLIQVINIEGSRILTNVRWLVSDTNLEGEFFLNNERLQKDDFLERLSEIEIIWYLNPNDPNKIIFLYPIAGEVNDDFEFDPVQAVAYNLNSLPTALEVIGAINSHYSEKAFNNQALNDREIETRNWILNLDYPKYLLLRESVKFVGLETIRPGVYLVMVELQ